MKYGSIIFLSLLMFGCKTHLTAEINVSDLNSEKLNDKSAVLYAEIASCNSYEDSRNPSSSLIEAQQTVTSLFDGAKFDTCFQQKMESFAQFSIPLMVGKINDDKGFAARNVKLFSNDSGLLLGLHMPKNIKDKFEQHNKKDFQINPLTPESVFITVTLNNDTDKTVIFSKPEMFINGSPTPEFGVTSVNLPAKSKIEFRLSNVQTARLLSPKEQGGSSIVMLLFKDDEA